MIAKSDILILTVATALLVFTLMRSTVLDPSGPPTGQISAATGGVNSSLTNTAGKPVVETVSYTASSTSTSTTNESGVLLDSDSGAVAVTQVDSSESTEFQQPEIIREAAFKTHIVKSGEYLGMLAQRYNTTVGTLQVLNNLEGSTIYVGQSLVYPEPY